MVSIKRLNSKSCIIYIYIYRERAKLLVLVMNLSVSCTRLYPTRTHTAIVGERCGHSSDPNISLSTRTGRSHACIRALRWPLGLTLAEQLSVGQVITSGRCRIFQADGRRPVRCMRLLRCRRWQRRPAPGVAARGDGSPSVSPSFNSRIVTGVLRRSGKQFDGIGSRPIRGGVAGPFFERRAD